MAAAYWATHYPTIQALVFGWLDARLGAKPIVIISLDWWMTDMIGGFDNFFDVISELIDGGVFFGD